MNQADVIEALAEKLGVGPQAIWSVLITQAPIWAMGKILECGLMFLFGFFAVNRAKRYLKREHNSLDKDEEFALTLWTVAGVALLIAGSVDTLLSLKSLFYAFCNPQYWALQRVLNP